MVAAMVVMMVEGGNDGSGGIMTVAMTIFRSLGLRECQKQILRSRPISDSDDPLL